MLEKIIDKHKEMMYSFIDLTGISDYELAWICFMTVSYTHLTLPTNREV